MSRAQAAHGFFVTGTDTDVGKTLVSATLVHALVSSGAKVAVMKPVASGCRETPAGLVNEDAEILMGASNVTAPYAEVNPYAFVPAIAPHLAARAASVTIDTRVIVDCFHRLQGRSAGVVVEGVGGWQVPLGALQTTEDLAQALGLPVVLVVGMRLGCLSHALLTAQAIQAAGLPLAGWVANCIDPGMDRLEDNIEDLGQRLGICRIATIPYSADKNYHALASHVNVGELIDIF